MEELIEAGFIAGALDVTTTEFCDDWSSAACSRPGPTGSSPPGALGIPQVVSLGALDMVNFGAARHGARALPRTATCTSTTRRSR